MKVESGLSIYYGLDFRLGIIVLQLGSFLNQKFYSHFIDKGAEVWKS
jgi:hypothetical protein